VRLNLAYVLVLTTAHRMRAMSTSQFPLQYEGLYVEDRVLNPQFLVDALPCDSDEITLELTGAESARVAQG